MYGEWDIVCKMTHKGKVACIWLGESNTFSLIPGTNELVLFGTPNV